MLWTTRDGREIPLEEMSDEHVRNAIAALSRWRARIRRQDGQQAMKRQLDDAIARFRRILRGRLKAAGTAKPVKRGGQRRLGRG